MWSTDRVGAISKARRKLEKALRQKSIVNDDVLAKASVDVEEVEVGANVFHLFRRQGFVFHKLDG